MSSSRTGVARRPPEPVLERLRRRVATEVELTREGTTRHKRIVAGYADATWFEEVRFLAVARRLARRLAERPDPADLAPIATTSPAFALAPVPGLSPETRAAIDRLS